ncbi:sortase [Enterococcus faecium]|nr:sortase [Enterococcus faecium]
MKNYDPNIRLGTHTIKVSFQRWDYKGFVTFRRGGNCKGLDVLALDEDDLYDQTLTDNPIGFGLLPEDDEGNLFDDLPSVKKGEKFYIKVDGEQHAYQIDRIEEVQKDELQRNFVTYLEPNPNEDRVTLMTCTPKGINTHRFLVYGKRVTFTKSELKDEENKKQKLSWKWLLGSTVFLSVMIIGSLFVYKKKK